MLAFPTAILLITTPAQVGGSPPPAPVPAAASASQPVEATRDQQTGTPTPSAAQTSPAPALTTPPPVEQPAPPPPAQTPEPASPDNPENDVIVTAPKRPMAPDPFEGVNLKAFAVTEAVDKAIIGPVSLAYKHHVPSPVRSGIHNFLYNLREPVVFVNFLLQLKIGKAAETVGRFTINSTVGVAGVMDIAKRKPFHWHRRGNGFADTLGFYGIPNGPFMFLPIVGPTTVRDLFGGFVDRLILPVGVGSPFNSIKFGAPAGVLGALDHRADFDEELHILHDNVPNPYESSRDFYLRRRQAEIDYLKGRGTAAAPMSENPLGYIAPSRPAGVVPPPVVPTLATPPQPDMAKPAAVPAPAPAPAAPASAAPPPVATAPHP